jgi:hypothetical protein
VPQEKKNNIARLFKDLKDNGYPDSKDYKKIYKLEDYDLTSSDADYIKIEAEKEGIHGYVSSSNNGYAGNVTFTKEQPKGFGFKTGGLVDYTGPAWVDGTKKKPEAFLNAEDTQRIGEAAELLSNLELLSNDNVSKQEISNTNVGDTTIEIHINIENVASDYDVDQAVERVKEDIVKAAQYAGSNVILKKS